MIKFPELFFRQNRLLFSLLTVGKGFHTSLFVLTSKGVSSHCYALYCSSRLEQIMSKRTAVDEVFVYPKKKRQHQEAADKAEDISAINKMALNSGVINVCTSLTSTTNFETAAFSPSQKDTASVAGVMEDSQIEVTPDAKQILNSKPNMPGFRLNQCRSFPSPKFDVEEKEPEALKTVSKSKCSNVQSLEKQSHRQQRPRHRA